MHEEKAHKSYIPQDWRILAALILTLVWFLFLFLYIARNVGWGSFIQQSVLAENNEELRRNNLHSEKQTQAIAATEMNARQETFFKIAEATRRQLGSNTGLLFISSQGPTGNETYSSDDIAEIWKQFAGGDVEVFSRLFLTMAAITDQDFFDLFYGTEIRRRHTETFLVGYDRLVELSKGCDIDNIILDSLLYSAHGLLNVRMRELHPDIKFEIIAGTNSTAYLEQMISTDESIHVK